MYNTRLMVFIDSEKQQIAKFKVAPFFISCPELNI